MNRIRVITENGQAEKLASEIHNFLPGAILGIGDGHLLLIAETTASENNVDELLTTLGVNSRHPRNGEVIELIGSLKGLILDAKGQKEIESLKMGLKPEKALNHVMSMAW